MRLAIFISLFCFSVATLCSSLPPEHESARLLLVIEEAVSNENWPLADDSLTKMADLQVDLPVPFFFYNGWVHFKQGRFEKAQRSLEHYVVKTGASGAFYNDALRLLTSVDSMQSKKPSESGENEPKVDSLMPESDQPLELLLGNNDRDAYVQSLQALFLTESPIQALVMHINSLLSAHPFTGIRIKKASEKQGVKFQISIQDNVLVLQERNFQDGFPQLSAKRFEVSGVDPFIRFDCSSKDIVCWLYHPANKHERWLFVDHDELVASELAHAVTRLIQLLQQK